jgi:hypothetical protein
MRSSKVPSQKVHVKRVQRLWATNDRVPQHKKISGIRLQHPAAQPCPPCKGSNLASNDAFLVDVSAQDHQLGWFHENQTMTFLEQPRLLQSLAAMNGLTQQKVYRKKLIVLNVISRAQMLALRANRNVEVLGNDPLSQWHGPHLDPDR